MKPKTIRKHLKQIIDDLSANPVLFRRDPRRDFTHTRKLSFSDTVSVVLQMEGKSTANEMLNFCCSANASSASALRQRLCNKLSNERTFDLHSIIKVAYFAGGSILEIPPPLFFYRLGSFFPCASRLESRFFSAPLLKWAFKTNTINLNGMIICF